MSAEFAWKEVSKFHPLPKSFYEKQQGLGSTIPTRFKARPIQTSSLLPTRTLLPSSGRYIPNRKQISQLIQCLAISETQKMQLEHQINEITRQKEELNTQLAVAMKEKDDILKEQKQSASVLVETNSVVASKTADIEILQKKLKDLEESSKIQNAKIISGTENEELEIPKTSNLLILEERLNQIQHDIKALNSKISKDRKEKDTISATSNSSRLAVSLPDDNSSLSQPSSLVDSSSKTNEDLPSLELLLRKILKSRKVHYKDPLDEQETYEMSVNATDSQEKSEQEISTPKAAQKQKIEKNQKNPIVIIDETKSKNAATSPPNESYLFLADRRYKGRKREKKKDSTKSRNHSDSSIRYHQTKDSSSCACATCSSNVSWICPDCFHSDHSVSLHHNHSDHSVSLHHNHSDHQNTGRSREKNNVLHEGHSFYSRKKPFAGDYRKMSAKDDASVLFTNDTSMIRPLADIVSDMDQIPNNNQKESFLLAHHLETDGELLEVISSLNGLH